MTLRPSSGASARRFLRLCIVVPRASKAQLLWWINDRIEGNEEFVDWPSALERSEGVRRPAPGRRLGGCDMKGFCVFCSFVAVVSAQAPAAPTFDVTSVKTNTSGDARDRRAPWPGGRFSMVNETVWRLIGGPMPRRNPYRRLQIAGGPTWIDTDRFDHRRVVAAPAHQGASTADASRLAGRIASSWFVHTENTTTAGLRARPRAV